jgi:hypothetical protein
MQKSDRPMAKRLHAIVKASASDLVPRTWYGMPAYAKDGKVVCFFQSAQKFKTTYATFGFNATEKSRATFASPRRRVEKHAALAAPQPGGRAPAAPPTSRHII